MNKKLNLSELNLRKGGCMFRKVLAVLVMGCMVFSNVCFAAPTASLPLHSSVKSAVDNMALQSFLQKGSTSQLENNKNAFANMLKLLTGQAYSDEKAGEIIDMWKKNLASGELSTASERLAAVNAKLNNNVVFDEATGNIEITKDGELFVKVEDGKVTVGENVFKGLSGKSDNPANRQSLIERGTKAENLTTLSDETKEDYLTQLGKILGEAKKSGKLDENLVKAEDIIKAGRAIPLKVMGIVADDESNWIGGYKAEDAHIIAKELDESARINQYFHEILEGMGFADKDIMAIQRKVDPMGTEKTSKKLEEAVKNASVKTEVAGYAMDAETKTALAEGEAAQKRIESKNAQAGDEQKVAEGIAAAETFTSTLSPEDQQKAVALDLQTRLTVYAGLASKTTTENATKLTENINAFFGFIEKSKTAGMDGMNAKDVANLLSQGDKIALHLNDIAEYNAATGVWTLKASVVAMLRDLSLPGSTVKPGALNFIGLGNAYNDITKQLALFGIKEIIALHAEAGAETTLVTSLASDQKLRVILSDMVTTQIGEQFKGAGANVVLIKVNGFNAQTNILQVVATSLRLTPEEIANLMDANGVVQLKNINLTVETYDEMQKEYVTVKALLIQA